MAIREFATTKALRPRVLHVDSFVSERFGFVYQCIPKALSRSMLRYLTSVDPGGYRLGDRELVDLGNDRMTSFTFVRHPYARVVSVYFNKFVDFPDNDQQKAMFAKYEHLRPDMTLPEFVAWLATDEARDRNANRHFLSQHFFLLDKNRQPAINYVGKVERIDEDLPELQRRLGLTVEPLPHLNSSRNAERANWNDLLDGRSKRILNERYERDFELLGYDRSASAAVSFSLSKARSAAASALRRTSRAKTKARRQGGTP